MSLLNKLPLFPLYYSGKTKFMPIHCSDLTDIIFHVITKNVNSKIIECVGPETISFKEILEKLINLIEKEFLYLFHYYLLRCRLIFWNISKPLLTLDQLILLKYHNINSENTKLISKLVYQVFVF